MLLMGSPRRLSIDIDIITEIKREELEKYFDRILEERGFTAWEPDERENHAGIVKAHYKFYFDDVLGQRQPQHIILDVLFEVSKYGELQEHDIICEFVACREPLKVSTPSLEGILGDKLTAFAPNTTGIPYYRGTKPMGMEIMKQLYDIGCIFEHVHNLGVISATFKEIAKDEISYRGLYKESDAILCDIIDTAKVVTERGKYEAEKYDILEKGRQSVGSFIFSETFHIDRAIILAARTAYLAHKMLLNESYLEKYDNTVDMTDWTIIGRPEVSGLNRLKRGNPEAFYYWYRIHMG